MQIDRIYYPVKTLGPGQRIGIWTVGCPRRCIGCASPELWQSNSKREVSIRQIYQMLNSVKQPISGVTISGGEPFYQLRELAKLAVYIREHITSDILVYTGYTLRQLREAPDSKAIETIFSNIAVLIDGAYQDKNNDNKPLRGSANQQIHFFKEEYRQVYEKELYGQRKMQNVFYGQGGFSIGIPLKG